MSTDRLIATLAADRTQDMAPSRLLLLALAAGAIGAGVLFFLVLGPRGNFVASLTSWRFVMKFVVTLALAASAAVLVMRAARPQAKRSDALLALAPLVLMGMVIAEIVATPYSIWMPHLMGHNAMACLICIPLFALVPLATLLFALHRGAPLSPVWAGALAGLAAGGLGAAFYAAHCPDDSPLFVAVWYTLAITFVTVVGAALGKRVLAW
jgi:hypothetical protein